jgi:hypothetical protein
MMTAGATKITEAVRASIVVDYRPSRRFAGLVGSSGRRHAAIDLWVTRTTDHSHHDIF